MRRHMPLVLLAIVALSAPVVTQPAANQTTKDLRALFAEERVHELQIDPPRASASGDRRWNDRWPDLSLPAIEAEEEHLRHVLARLDGADQSQLSASDRLNYTLFRMQREQELEEHELRWYLLPVRHNVGIHVADQLASSLRFQTVKDYDDWLARLRSFPTYMDQTIALMREGIRTRTLYPKFTMQRVPKLIDRQIVAEPTASGFYRPFAQFPASIAEADRARLSADAKAAIATGVVPAYRKFKEFFSAEYLPASFATIGVWQMPAGDRVYNYWVRKNTTTAITAKEVHEQGLAEVARIHAEMQAAIDESGFKGTFAEFATFLRTDRRFYYASSDELLDAYRVLAKRIDPLLVKVFRKLPRMPYGVEPVPSGIAADTVAGYYGRGTADGTRAGTLFVNVSKPETRPKYEMLTLALHEGVPGHHLQRAIAMELTDVPDFRVDERFPVFSEGWALYAESLGEDMGLTSDPYARFGRLSGEMWRAVRLVVDTGIHWGHWDRPRAIAYFTEQTARPESDIEQEIDRYTEIPGQALAYKTGEMKIKALRARASAVLGKAFDLREFNNVVLELGTIPLGPLERHVDEWIAARRASSVLPSRH
jgi:uncharacterized protein (DUF885 family)